MRRADLDFDIRAANAVPGPETVALAIRAAFQEADADIVVQLGRPGDGGHPAEIVRHRRLRAALDEMRAASDLLRRIDRLEADHQFEKHQQFWITYLTHSSGAT